MGYDESNNFVNRQEKNIITKRSKEYSDQPKVEFEVRKEPVGEDEFRIVCNSPVNTALKADASRELTTPRKQAKTMECECEFWLGNTAY